MSSFFAFLWFILLAGALSYFFTMRKYEKYSKRTFQITLAVSTVFFIGAIIAAPETSNSTVTAQNDKLLTTNKKLEAKNEKVKAENKKLKTVNDELTTKAEESTTEIETLNTQIAELTAQIEELHTNNEALVVRNQELETNNQQLTAAVASNSSSPSSTNSAAPASSTVAEQPNVQNTQQTVYWTPNGDKYHSTSSCRTLSRSKTILSGTTTESHRTPCAVCH